MWVLISVITSKISKVTGITPSPNTAPSTFSLPARTPTQMIVKELMGKLEVTVLSRELCLRKADIIKPKDHHDLAHIDSMIFFPKVSVPEMKENVLQPSDRFLSLKRIIFSQWFHRITFNTSDCAGADYKKISPTAISCSWH